MQDAQPRSPRISATDMTEIVLPQHANSIGTAFGGTILGWIDICGAIAAQRHCGRTAVTAAIDDLDFVAPIRVGDIVRLTARVNAVFRSSVEVEVRVEVEDVRTMAHALSVLAHLTFVHLGDDGRPSPAPALLAESPDDERRVQEAERRRERRLSRKYASRA